MLPRLLLLVLLVHQAGTAACEGARGEEAIFLKRAGLCAGSEEPHGSIFTQHYTGVVQCGAVCAVWCNVVQCGVASPSVM